MQNNLHEEIAKVAYDLHNKRGFAHGHDMQDWLEAEKIVLARYQKNLEKGKSKIVTKNAPKRGREATFSA